MVSQNWLCVGLHAPILAPCEARPVWPMLLQFWAYGGPMRLQAKVQWLLQLLPDHAYTQKTPRHLRYGRILDDLGIFLHEQEHVKAFSCQGRRCRTYAAFDPRAYAQNH